MADKVCVYDIVLKGEVVYVGITNNPALRLRAHRSTGVAPKDANMIVHRWHASRGEALIAERRRQDELQPAFCNDLSLRRKPAETNSYDWEAHRENIEKYVSMFSAEEWEEYFRLVPYSKTKMGNKFFIDRISTFGSK